MPSIDTIIEQDDFSAGMVRDVAPHLIPENGVYDIINGFNGDEDGSIFKRGGTSYYSPTSLANGLRHIWTGHLTPGERVFVGNTDNFCALNGTTVYNLNGDGLTRAVSCAEIGGLLFIGGGYIYGGSLKSVPYSTGTISVTNGSATVTGSGTSWSTNVDAGMLLQRGNERVYVVKSVESDTSLTLTENYEGSNGSGATYTAHNIYEITAADPYYASDTYAVSTARLLWHDDRNIHFSPLRLTAPQENPHTHAATDYHTVPDGVRIVGLASIGQLVLVFTTGGVWRLGGLAYNIVDAATGTPQHSFELLSRDYVLANPAGISSWQQFLVVPCTDGIYLIDGTSSPIRISKSIDPLWAEYVRLGYNTGNAAVYRNRYFLPILSANEVKDVLVCRLDRAISDRRRRVAFPWSRLKGSGAEMAGYAVKNAADPRRPKLLGAEYKEQPRVCDCTAYLKPSDSSAYDADGTVPEFEITTRDYQTGGLTLNTVRWIRLGYELISDPTWTPTDLILDYASGIKTDGAPAWGDPAGEWGTGFGPSGTSPWTPLSEGEFSPVLRRGIRDRALDATLTPHRFRLNKRLRYVRLKLRRYTGASTSCVVRRLELQIRPSQAVRR